MKILLISHFDTFYGANKSMLSLVEQLKVENVDCTIVVQKNGNIASYLKEKSIPYFVIPFRNEVGFKRNFFKGILYYLFNHFLVFFYFMKLRREKFDVVHTNSSISFFGTYLASFLKIKHVYHIREFLDKDYGATYLLGKTFFVKQVKKSDAVISISECIRKYRYPESQVIYNGVIFERELDTKIVKKNNSVIISIIGHIVPGKNQLQALEAVNILKDKCDVRIFIVGEGEASYVEQLHQYVELHNLNKIVTFTGYIADPSEYYIVSDVVYMCSLNEGLGRVTIEAMANEAAVIGYNNAGTAEIIQDGINGYLYDSLEEMILKTSLFINDGDRKRITDAAKRDIKLNYTLEVYAKRLKQVYDNITTHAN